MHIDKTLMKLKYVFLLKDNKLLEKYNAIWEKVKVVSKQNLIVNVYTMKKM